ncbi:hypothetical protein BJF83_21510 [Nocardiopsis sp. CNR-923]|uniref:hypothetical protein n=1 Tax=Nocardiopsis sp. CNR-923 TaxID=1904965 RepID=UPI000966E7F6|nr:hypothetical protein [Nocardiopsis sp. CNR-923]OLT26381.1 hypothetical protein BJF83_21510 [Nocardiopsis sp. CNR-923]
MIICPPAPGCTRCGTREPGWFTVGEVDPRPGETFTDVRDLPSTRRPGRTRQVRVQVPAWPIARLIAVCCYGCHDIALYDRDGADGFAEIPYMRPTLF